MSAAILIEADYSAIEQRMVVMLSIGDVIVRIRSRAGVKVGKGNALQPAVHVYFTVAADSERPPTLQRIDPRSKRRLASYEKKFGRVERRVLVGRAWVQKNMPEEWAALCAARLQGVRLEDHIPTLVRNS